MKTMIEFGINRSALVSIVTFRTVTNINFAVFHVDVFLPCSSFFTADG